MATEILKKFADELKSARETRGISLKQIATKTKIDLKFLQAIEKANFEILPDLYMRAFIKEFAQSIDLNPADILNKYETAVTGKVEESARDEQPENQKEKQEIISSELQTVKKEFDATETQIESKVEELKPNTSINYIYVAAVFLVTLLIIYFVFFNETSPEIIQENTEQSTSADNERFKIDNSAQAQSENESQNLLNKNQTNLDSLRLVVQTTERVWVKVTTDGKIVHQQIVQANSKLNFAATKSFSVSVGNAGFVKLFYNNKPVENIGKIGEIRNIYITSDNIRYYTIAPEVKNEQKSAKKN